MPFPELHLFTRPGRPSPGTSAFPTGPVESPRADLWCHGRPSSPTAWASHLRPSVIGRRLGASPPSLNALKGKGAITAAKAFPKGYAFDIVSPWAPGKRIGYCRRVVLAPKPGARLPWLAGSRGPRPPPLSLRRGQHVRGNPRAHHGGTAASPLPCGSSAAPTPGRHRSPGRELKIRPRASRGA